MDDPDAQDRRGRPGGPPPATVQSADEWLDEYTVLNLRLNRCITAQIGDDSLLDYVGPAEHAMRVRQEPEPAPAHLILDAQRLRQTLPAQGFEPARAAHLLKLVRALDSVARRVAGEAVSLREQALDWFDLHVDYVPDHHFTLAHAMYDDALPGTGDVMGRLHRWRAHHTLPEGRRQLLRPVMQRALDESRRRTRRMVPLPSDEEVGIATLQDQPFRAVAAYHGNYRSQILINETLPFNLAELLYVVCHEGYPGHLAELVLKEQHLTRQRGYREQQVGFLLTPPFVISEGLALWAHRLAFPDDEAERWLAAQVYREVGIAPDGSRLSRVLQATDLLWGVRCNAALMLEDGRSERETVHYLKHYALMDDAAASRTVSGLRLPMREAYIFTYHHGLQLLEPWLGAGEPARALTRLLTRQVLPSTLGDVLST
ncbi:hypothetical protein [Deinococcus sonorensis]|uniref:DUF885 domain-containing protein n=2 Tax=Deinococcus sonorensis TaxID=309891 RepID=A0AAU7UGN7_9DEIO